MTLEAMKVAQETVKEIEKLDAILKNLRKSRFIFFARPEHEHMLRHYGYPVHLTDEDLETMKIMLNHQRDRAQELVDLL